MLGPPHCTIDSGLLADLKHWHSGVLCRTARRRPWDLLLVDVLRLRLALEAGNSTHIPDSLLTCTFSVPPASATTRSVLESKAMSASVRLSILASTLRPSSLFW